MESCTTKPINKQLYERIITAILIFIMSFVFITVISI